MAKGNLLESTEENFAVAASAASDEALRLTIVKFVPGSSLYFDLGIIHRDELKELAARLHDVVTEFDERIEAHSKKETPPNVES